LVKQFTAASSRATWAGKNEQGDDVTPGIYIYIIISPTGEKIIGKIFLVR